MLLPGQIENYIVIVNVNKLGVSEISKAILSKIIECLSKGYRYRTKRMYILNATFAIRMFWKVMETFMSAQMRSKMVMADKNTTPELLEEFHPDQLEKRFSGNAPNLTSFWPPHVPQGDFGIEEDSLISESHYISLLKENSELEKRPDLREKVQKNISISE